MTLSIHGIAASRAIRPLWVAAELGLSFEHVPTAFAGGATRTPEFLALNPNGHIPVVVDERSDGPIVLWESMACALYIARHHGVADGVSITPANAAEDAQALKWAFWTVTEIESDALTVLMHRMVMSEARRKPELAQAAENRLAGPLKVLEQHLQAQAERGQAHLAADRFTVADVCVASVVNWVRPAKELMAQHPLLHAWLLACMDRPAQRAAKVSGA
jgi:glutathione S-transferase